MCSYNIINRLTFTEQCALKSVTAPIVFCGALYLPTGNLSTYNKTFKSAYIENSKRNTMHFTKTDIQSKKQSV